MNATSQPRTSNPLAVVSALAPLILLGALVYWFFHGGSKLIELGSRSSSPTWARRLTIVRAPV